MQVSLHYLRGLERKLRISPLEILDSAVLCLPSFVP